MDIDNDFLLKFIAIYIVVFPIVSLMLKNDKDWRWR